MINGIKIKVWGKWKMAWGCGFVKQRLNTIIGPYIVFVFLEVHPRMPFNQGTCVGKCL